MPLHWKGHNACRCGPVHLSKEERKHKRVTEAVITPFVRPSASDAVMLFESASPPTKRKKKNKGVGKKIWTKKMRRLPCHYCGQAGGTIDHKVPRRLGGRDIEANCVPCCQPCNNWKESVKGGGPWSYVEFKAFGWKTRPFAGV